MRDAAAAASPARAIFAGVGCLLGAQPWVRDALTLWPAPIATELAQLLRMLGAGVDAGGLLMQVRDTAEVLLKTLTLVAARDLMAHGGPDGATAARLGLFSGRLALGTWTTAFASFAALPADGLLLPELLALANNDGRFVKAMRTYVMQRNDDIGHGAYRPDSVALARQISLHLLGPYDQYRPLPEANRYTGGLDRAFAAVAASGVWQGCTLHADSPGGWPFMGADATHALRPHAQPGDAGAERHLVLVRNGRALDLWPFITGRICRECGQRDASYSTPRDRPSRATIRASTSSTTPTATASR